MDALMRLGARAIDAAVDGAAVVRPLAAPIFLDAAQPLVRDAVADTGPAPESRPTARPLPAQHDPVRTEPRAEPPAGPGGETRLLPRNLSARSSDRDAGETLPNHRSDSDPAEPPTRSAIAPSAFDAGPPLVAGGNRAQTRTEDAIGPSSGPVRATTDSVDDPRPAPADLDLIAAAPDPLPERMRAALHTIRQSVAAGSPGAHAGVAATDRGERPPAVHVTIGRIEVRSVTSAPEALRVPHAAAPPRVTLAEYLSRRRSTP